MSRHPSDHHRSTSWSGLRLPPSHGHSGKHVLNSLAIDVMAFHATVRLRGGTHAPGNEQTARETCLCHRRIQPRPQRRKAVAPLAMSADSQDHSKNDRKHSLSWHAALPGLRTAAVVAPVALILGAQLHPAILEAYLAMSMTAVKRPRGTCAMWKG